MMPGGQVAALRKLRLKGSSSQPKHWDGGQHLTDTLGQREFREPRQGREVAFSPQQWAATLQGGWREGTGQWSSGCGPVASQGLPLRNSRRGSYPDPLQAWLSAESSETCWQLQMVQVSSAVPRDSTVTQTTHTPTAVHREGTLSWGFWHLSRDTCGCHTLRTSYSAVGGDGAQDIPENQSALCPQRKDGLRPHFS